jgi:hypothetical protein
MITGLLALLLVCNEILRSAEIDFHLLRDRGPRARREQGKLLTAAALHHERDPDN